MTNVNEGDATLGAGAPPTAGLGRSYQLLALAAAAYLLLGLAGEQVGRVAQTSRALGVGAAVAIAVLFIGVALALVVLIARMALPWRRQLALVVILGAASAASRLVRAVLVGDLLLVLAATWFGALVSRVVRERNMLVPVAVAAAAVDTWGVYFGFVKDIADKAPAAAQHLSAQVPGASTAGAPLLQSVGVGDFLFLGLYVTAVLRLRMNGRGTVWALFAVFLAVPVVFSIISVRALPGLPFLGLAVVAANLKYFRFSRAEKFALLYAALVVAALTAAAWGVRQALG